MTATFDTIAVGGMDVAAVTNLDSRLHAAKFSMLQTVVSPLEFTNDGREVLMGRYTIAAETENRIPAGSVYYTCDTFGNSPERGTTEGEGSYGEILRYRRERFEGIGSRAQLISSPHSAVQWAYLDTTPAGNKKLEPYEPKFGSYLWMGRNDLICIVGQDGSNEAAIPACGVGWFPNAPSVDGITVCNNNTTTPTRLQNAYEVISRTATDEDWTLALSGIYQVFDFDSFLPTVNSSTMKAWAKQGRQSGSAAQFKVWNVLEDPLDGGTSVTTVTIPSGTITSWIHEGNLTGVLSSGNDVYIYDGTTLSQTISTGSGAVGNWAMRGDWLITQRTIAAGTYHFHKIKDDGTGYDFHSTETKSPTSTVLLGEHGIGIEGGSKRWRYSATSDSWIRDEAWYPGVDLGTDGWSWSTVLNDTATYFKDDRVAFAAIS